MTQHLQGVNQYRPNQSDKVYFFRDGREISTLRKRFREIHRIGKEAGNPFFLTAPELPQR